ncbi:DUF1707 domain-containing protein [Streptomyces sp. NPDC092296]|uniref:DUF1707 SHOCT-like domain-containing protein n=1 Tax=Streptomyces sp. NPDC092296 TaxID=3366012 RepID=UPI0037F6A515
MTASKPTRPWSDAAIDPSAADLPAADLPAADLPAADLRAADHDRDRTAARLADALAQGRLTPEEHAERLEAAYSARTLAELAPLTRDLPAETDGRPTAPVAPGDGEPVVVVLSKLRRGGQWPVPPLSAFRARFGALVLDLSHAVFTRREVVIEAGSFCGKVEMVVPDDAQVYDTGTALLGKRSTPGDHPGRADGPVIRITGRSVLGHLRVVRESDAPFHH